MEWTSEVSDGTSRTTSKEYIRPMPATWWLKRKTYFLFMVRELTSLFIGGYLVFLLVWLYHLGQGPEQFQALLMNLRQPVSVALHLLALAAALYHSITWFNLTPTAMPLRIGEERLPSAAVAIAMGYLPWMVVSGLILWSVLR